ncbi:MAG: hypothetical protein KKB70_06300 [Proteobacteria bacterium]|nr:hypothetical protein [Pseudomonadota bacterium]
MKKLIITKNSESARTLASVVQAEWTGDFFDCDTFRIVSTGGEIFNFGIPEQQTSALGNTIPFHRLPILPVQIQVDPIETRIPRLDFISSLVEDAQVDGVVFAMDPNSQGELFSRRLASYLAIQKPLWRLWLNSMSTAGIKRAFEEIEAIGVRDGLAAAAFMRADADWIFNTNLTLLCSLLLNESCLPVDRLAMPVLASLVARNREIESFKSQPFFVLEIGLSLDEEDSFYATWFDPKKPDTISIKTHEQAVQIRKKILGKPAPATRVLSVHRQNVKEAPPWPFDMGSLQAQAAEALEFEPSRTLDVSLELYEKGFLTYVCTNCRNVPLSVYENLSETIAACHPHFMTAVESLVGPSMFWSPTGAPPAWVTEGECLHHGILPTEVLVDFTALSEDEQEIYLMVCQRVIAALMPPAIFLETSVVVECGGYHLRATGKQLIRSEWLDVEKHQDFVPTVLPYLEENDELTVVDSREFSKKTFPPDMHTVESLLTPVLPVNSSPVFNEFGTPEMRTNAVEWLCEQGYAEEDNLSYSPTEKGAALVEFLEFVRSEVPSIDVLLSMSLAKQWDERIHTAIAMDSKDSRAAYLELTKDVRRCVESIVVGCREKNEIIRAKGFKLPVLGNCPECGNAVVERANAYNCQSTTCKFVIFKKMYGIVIKPSRVKELLELGQTNPMQLMTKDDKPYRASLTWKTDRKKVLPLFEENELGICPICKKGKVVETPKTFGCKRWKTDGCQFTLWKHGSQGITRKAVIELLQGKETSGTYIFTKANGEVFRAKVKLESDGEITYVFPPTRAPQARQSASGGPQRSLPQTLDLDAFFAKKIAEKLESENARPKTRDEKD